MFDFSTIPVTTFWGDSQLGNGDLGGEIAIPTG